MERNTIFTIFPVNFGLSSSGKGDIILSGIHIFFYVFVVVINVGLARL